jgi:hypothetical protein
MEKSADGSISGTTRRAPHRGATSHAGMMLWPTPSDELLLRACLLDNDEAIAAWREWHDHADYTNLDAAQRRLLPLLHENLSRLGVTEAIFEHYRRVSTQLWLQSQMLFRHTAQTLRSLSDIGIRAMVLKGVPLALRYYARPGLRPMGDADVLVDPLSVRPATAYFLSRGWVCVDGFIESLDGIEALMEVRHAFNLLSPEGQQIDLHWNVFPAFFGNQQTLWDGAESLRVNDWETLSLCATDHLLHACSQAAGWNVVRPIRWIPDAQAIVRAGKIDWDRLVENAGRFGLVQPARDSLAVLRELLRLEIPDHVFARLSSMSTSLVSRIDYRLSARRPIPIVGRPLQRYVRYLHTASRHGLGFGTYMKQLWGVSSFSRLLKLGLKRLYLNATGR